MLNEYGFNENSYLWDATHQVRHEIYQLREEVVKTIEVQTETQTSDAEKMRTNQTSLFGKLIDTIKSVFTGNNESGDSTNAKLIRDVISNLKLIVN